MRSVAEVLEHTKPLLSESNVPSIWYVKTMVTLQKFRSEHFMKEIYLAYTKSLFWRVDKHMDNRRISLNLKPETKGWTDGKCLTWKKNLCLHLQFLVSVHNRIIQNNTGKKLHNWYSDTNRTWTFLKKYVLFWSIMWSITQCMLI